jgi:hypothetical protein
MFGSLATLNLMTGDLNVTKLERSEDIYPATYIGKGYAHLECIRKHACFQSRDERNGGH